MERVLRTLSRLRALPEQPAIVVVDNASSDGTAAAITERFPEITLIRMPRNVGAAGRNRGVAAARTAFVAFCDDDTWWADGAIARGAQILAAHPTVALISARILVGSSGIEDPVCEQMRNSPLPSAGLPGRMILGFMAGACMVRVQAFAQVGGYCPRFFLGGEEELVALDLAARGWQMVYCDELIVHHFPSSNRDSGTRHALLACNSIWVACLRLSWLEVIRRVCKGLLKNDSKGRRVYVIWQVLRGLPWVLRSRKVIPREVEAMRRCIQAPRVSPPLITTRQNR